MTDNKSIVDLYAKVISEQARKGMLSESENSPEAVEKKVSNSEKIGVGHLASHGTHHVLSPYDSSTNEDEMSYIHHDTTSGKTSHFSLPSEKVTADQVHKTMNKSVSGGVHKDLAKKVAKAHNEDF